MRISFSQKLLLNIWTALGAAAMTCSTFLLSYEVVDLPIFYEDVLPFILILVFAATLGYYSVITTQRSEHGEIVLVAVVISGAFIALLIHPFGFMLYYLLQPYWFENLFLLLLACLFALFYTSSSGTRKRKAIANLRDLPFLKAFMIAYCWTIVTAFVPQLIIGEFNSGFLFSRFLFILAISLLFDIVDVEQDRGVIKTFPTWLGVNGTKLLAVILLLVSELLLKESLEFENWTLYSAVVFIALLFITPGRKWWKSMVLDGTMILYFVMVWF